MSEIIAKEFVEQAIYRMDESTRMVKTSLDLLSEDDIWKKPNNASNSVGNLILHLCGNITQYVIASLGEIEDTRERSKEFAVTSELGKEKLWTKLFETVELAKSTILQVPIEKLLKKRRVQGFDLSGIGIVMHAVEHYSYHTGQIAFWTKLLREKDLGFYDGLDLTIKNKD